MSLADRHLSHRLAAKYGTGGRLGWQSAFACLVWGFGESRPVTPQSIRMQNGIELIGEEAFSGSLDLQNIELPDSIFSIGTGAFSHCESLTSIKWPQNAYNVPEKAFWECVSLKEVVLPDTVTEIGISAFEGCPLSGELKLPDSINTICKSAFQECMISSVEIPQNCFVDTYAFFHCSLLEKVVIHQNVTIGDSTFGRPNANLVIYGYADSQAAQYCIENKVKFKLIDDNE